MKNLRARRVDELNQAIVKRGRRWVRGVLAAAVLADEYYNAVSTHEYSIGDCILLKFNLLRKKQVRKNPRRLFPTERR